MPYNAAMSWPRTTLSDKTFAYDVCLSFANEQRYYVRKVAEFLTENDVRVFYDEYERAELWGKDLFEHLNWVYSEAARYCVVFVSKAYNDKIWTSHERRSAQERALYGKGEYILPVMFDDTRIPGLRRTVSYLDGRNTDPEEVARLVISKIRKTNLVYCVPPNPSKLFEMLELEDEGEKKKVRAIACSFVESFKGSTVNERRLFFYCILLACPRGGLDSPHISVDRLRRTLDASEEEVINRIRRLQYCGVIHTLDFECASNEVDEFISIGWEDRWTYTDPSIRPYSRNNSTRIATAMVRAAIDHICENCIERVIADMDFSSLSR